MVLSNSAGTGLNWNSTTEEFDNTITQYADADVYSILNSAQTTNISWDNVANTLSITSAIPVANGGTGLSTINNLELFFGGASTFQQDTSLTFDPLFGTLNATNFSGNGSALTNLNAGNITTGTLALTRGGTGATNQAGACLNILPPALPGQYLRYDGINWQGNYIPQYTDTDVKSVLSTAGGIGINWNPSVEQFDLERLNYATASLINGLQFCYEHNENITKYIHEPIIHSDDMRLVLNNNAIFQINVLSNTKKEKGRNGGTNYTTNF